VKILLVVRGSQGDIYPYLGLAVELEKRGHDVTLSLPRIFEKEARDAGVNHVLQAFDDIEGMIGDVPDTKNLLEWTRRVIASQFREIIPLLRRSDILVAANTEFAAASIAEYCGKPLIRTAYGPFIPGRVIPPPVFPWSKPHPVFRPAFLWALLNLGLNFMVKKIINRHRAALGMGPIADQADHAPSVADNYLMYSKYLGNTDPQWKYRWEIGGYCFNDTFPYNRKAYEECLAFIKKDERPVIFFTLGSCNAEKRDRFAAWLFDICRENSYRLVVGCGWWEVGARLPASEDLFLLDSAVPHCLIFPHVTAIIHHGGSGTTHSASRAGKPQMVVPLLLDQFYWGERIRELGAGPPGVKMPGVSKKYLARRVTDLLTNPEYRKNAGALGELMRRERGLENICDHIESYGEADEERIAE
jgi:UDP:flavonoid glycosyltransferase YjiC (YdhE family)